MNLRFRSALLITLLLAAAAAFAGDKLKPEELTQKSVDAIGTPEARARIVGINASATGAYDILTHGSGHLDGKATVISQKGKFQYVSEFSSPEYQGEQITVDGPTPRIGANGTTTQSMLAVFLYWHPYLVRDGLFGGIYNGDWPFLDPANHPAKMHYDGIKKFNGKPAHQLSYDPKGVEGDMVIKVYFDAETYRHVGTTYTFTGQASKGRGIDVDQAQEMLEETFGDFTQAGELMLPTSWTIRYYGQDSHSLGVRWTFKFPDLKMLVRK